MFGLVGFVSTGAEWLTAFPDFVPAAFRFSLLMFRDSGEGNTKIIWFRFGNSATNVCPTFCLRHRDKGESNLQVATRERLKVAANGISVALSGGKLLHEVAAGLVRGLDLLRSHLAALDSEEKINALLDAADEPSQLELARYEVIARFVPMAMNVWIRKRLVDGVARLPGAKMGRKTIPDSEKVAICDEVSALLRKGNTMAIAKQRVAIRHEATVRTIDRVWSKRCDYTIDMDVETVQGMIDDLFRPKMDGEVRRIEPGGLNVAP